MAGVLRLYTAPHHGRHIDATIVPQTHGHARTVVYGMTPDTPMPDAVRALACCVHRRAYVVFVGDEGTYGIVLTTPPPPDTLSRVLSIYGGWRVVHVTSSHFDEVAGSENSDAGNEGGMEDARCPLCLDAIVSTEDHLVNLCGHVVHVSCQEMAVDPACPVCRYDVNHDAFKSMRCGACSSPEEGDGEMWMCLVCGDVYCTAHAHVHAESSHHQFAVQCGGCRVWDFHSGMLVDRVFAVEGEEGKKVAAHAGEGEGWSVDDDEFEAAVVASKTEAVAEYYSRLLQAQLEQQEAHYAELLRRSHASALHSLEHSESIRRATIATEAATAMQRSTAKCASSLAGVARGYAASKRQADQEVMLLQTTLAALEKQRGVCDTMWKQATASTRSVEEDRLRRRKEELQEQLNSLYRKLDGS